TSVSDSITNADIVAEAERLLAAAVAANVPVRLVGGLAVRMHLPPGTQPVITREYKDIDLVTLKGKSRLVGEFMTRQGYEADGMVNANRVAQLCAADWGLWRTTRMNTERTREALASPRTDPAVRDVVAPRLERLWEQVEAVPKSARWKMRNRVGDKVRWYEEP